MTLTAQQTADRAVTENELLTFVLGAARLYGWATAHFRPARVGETWRTAVQGDGKGYPDLVMIHPERGCLFVELKREQGKLRPEQEMWIALLQDAGQDVRVWRPSMRPDILRVLAGKATGSASPT